MLKRILILPLLIVSLQAQMGITINGGMFMSSPTGDGSDDMDALLAPTFGVSYAVGPVVTGAQYYSIGMTFDDSGITMETTLNYLGLYAMYPLALGPVTLGAGAMYGQPMGGNMKVEGSPGGLLDFDIDVEAGDMDSDLGVVINVNYPVTDAIGIGVGLIYGLGDVEHMTLGGGVSYSL